MSYDTVYLRRWDDDGEDALAAYFCPLLVWPDETYADYAIPLADLEKYKLKG